MDLIGILRKLGDRIGIIEMSSAEKQTSTPTKIQTRTITLSELMMTVQISEVHELAESPTDLSVPFEDIFKAAGHKAENTSWTVERLQEFLNSDRIRKLSREDAQRATLQMLKEQSVDAADIVKDAIFRDQALDAFEESVSRKRQRWIADQQQLLSDLSARMKQVEKEIAAEEERWKDWRGQKRQRERDMAYAVGFLIDRPVISIDNE
jgi:hypothetical protein